MLFHAVGAGQVFFMMDTQRNLLDATVIRYTREEKGHFSKNWRITRLDPRKSSTSASRRVHRAKKHPSRFLSALLRNRAESFSSTEIVGGDPIHRGTARN